MGITYEKISDLESAISARDVESLKTLIADPDILGYITSQYEYPLFRENRPEKLLIAAARSGSPEVVALLLTIPEVYENAAVDDNAAFYQAVQYGYTEVVEQLLKSPSVRAQAAAFDNEALRNAAENGQTDIVRLLLDIPAVYEGAALKRNAALRQAAENGHTDIVRLLLDIPAVKAKAALGANFALSAAVGEGHTEIVKLLLKIPAVVQHITVNDHAVLSEALYNSNWDHVSLLLQHYGRHSIPYSLVLQALTVPPEHPGAASIKAIVVNRAMTVNGYYNATSDEVNAINAWIAHWGLAAWPAGVAITNSSWCDYLSAQAAVCQEPKQAAIILLCLNEMSENHQRHLSTQQQAAGGGESAMESSLVAMVAKHYKEQIEPAFGPKFKELGDLEGVEQHIRWVLLNKIADKAAEPLKSQIQAKKQNILNGVEEDILWARSHFTAKDNIYQTAWRAYDAGAKTEEWKNLLTAPSPEDADETVFSIAETGSRGENLQSSSTIIRTMAAHYYLVAIDERLTDEEQEVALESFVAAIAEIRRAHNDKATGEDNPSCFPGCFTRLHEVTKRNSHIANIKPGLMAALREAYIKELEKAVTAGYMSCNEEQALVLYEALNMLSSANAWDVISSHPEKMFCMTTDDGQYTEALLKARQDFIAKYLPLQELLERLQHAMIHQHQIAMSEDDTVLVQALLADVSAGETAPYIESAYQKRIEALNKNPEPTTSVVRLSTSAASSEPNLSPDPNPSPGSGPMNQ